MAASRLVLVLVLLIQGCGGGSADTPVPTIPGPNAPGPMAPAPMADPVAGPETPQPTAPGQPAKVFALMDVGDPMSMLDGFAERTAVDGLAFRASWRTLEPLAGVYDWTTLDSAFDVVRARGKQLTLHVGASSIGLPSWIGESGAVTYTYRTPLGATATEPVPWDPVFLSGYVRFVAALAAHIRARGDSGLLYAISDGVPAAEMSLVGCQNGTLSGGIAYSRARYIDAWKTTIDAHSSAFSSTRLFVSAPVGVICMPDGDGRAFYTEVMDHALANNPAASVFAADLNARGSARMGQVDAAITDRAGIGFQMIWSSTNDPQNRMQGSLEDAVCHGIASGGRYFEIYKTDISSSLPAVQNAIGRARTGQPC